MLILKRCGTPPPRIFQKNLVPFPKYYYIIIMVGQLATISQSGSPTPLPFDTFYISYPSPSTKRKAEAYTCSCARMRVPRKLHSNEPPGEFGLSFAINL